MLTKRSSRVRLLGATSILAVMGLAACAPPAPPPSSNTVTSTANITLSCSGVGFAASLGTLPNQTVGLTVVRPTSVAPGAAYSITADLAPLALKRPNGIDLNAFSIPGDIFLQVSGGSITKATGTPTSFTDTGPLDTTSNSFPASGNIPPGTASGTAPGAPGTVTISANEVTIITGTTGFDCTLVGTAPTFTLTVS